MPLIYFGEVLEVDSTNRSPQDKDSQIITCHNKYSLEATRLTIPSDIAIDPNMTIHTYYLDSIDKKAENTQPIKLELYSRDENGNLKLIELINENGRYREKTHEEKVKTEEGNSKIMTEILRNERKKC